MIRLVFEHMSLSLPEGAAFWSLILCDFSQRLQGAAASLGPSPCSFFSREGPPVWRRFFSASELFARWGDGTWHRKGSTFGRVNSWFIQPTASVR